jgi:hypothetical protein
VIGARTGTGTMRERTDHPELAEGAVAAGERAMMTWQRSLLMLKQVSASSSVCVCVQS